MLAVYPCMILYSKTSCTCSSSAWGSSLYSIVSSSLNVSLSMCLLDPYAPICSCLSSNLVLISKFFWHGLWSEEVSQCQHHVGLCFTSSRPRRNDEMAWKQRSTKTLTLKYKLASTIAAVYLCQMFEPQKLGSTSCTVSICSVSICSEQGDLLLDWPLHSYLKGVCSVLIMLEDAGCLIQAVWSRDCTNPAWTSTWIICFLTTQSCQESIVFSFVSSNQWVVFNRR